MNYLTVKQVADRLACHVEHVLTLIGSGKLRASNIGVGNKRIWRVSEEDLESFMAERKNSMPIQVKNKQRNKRLGHVIQFRK